MEKIREITIDSARSKTRRNICLALIGWLLVIRIADSLISSSEWQKVAILVVILMKKSCDSGADFGGFSFSNHLALSGLLFIGIADSVISSSGWQKVEILGVILVGLLSQLTICQLADLDKSSLKI